MLKIIEKRISFIYKFVDLGYEVIEHLGVECLASFMKTHGWKVQIININYEKNLLIKIKEFKPHILGCSVSTDCILQITTLAQEIKNNINNLHIVYGGPGASAEAEKLLIDFPFINAVVIGEGEETLFELCEKIINKKNLNGIHGIFHKEGTHIIKEQNRFSIKNLDSLPFPGHNAFFQYQKNKRRVKFISIACSRGCIGNCNFCYKTFGNNSGKRIRSRSADNFVNEIEYLVKYKNIRRFSFIDQTFEDPGIIGKKRVNEIANLLISRKLDIIYTIHIRTENWDNSDKVLIQKMRTSGLIGIYPGLESGTDQGLKLFNKPAKVEDHIRTIKLFRSSQVAIDVGWIMFHPYSTIDEIEKNITKIEEMKLGHLGHILVNKLILFPGTKIVERLRKDRLLIFEPGYRNEEKGCPYRFECLKIERLVNGLYRNKPSLIDKMKLSESHLLSLDWGIFNSIITLKLRHYNKLKSFIELLEQEKEKAFQEIGQRNIKLFRHYLEFAGKGWNKNRQDEFEKKIEDNLIYEKREVFEKLRFSFFVYLKRNKINILNDFINL